MSYYSGYSMPYGSYGGAGYHHHNPYLYGNYMYPGSSYYYGGGYGGGSYYPYSYYGGRGYRPGFFRGLMNRIRYGSYYGNPYSPMGYDHHVPHRYYPEMNHVSSVKDLWRSNDIY
ncbi:hypothetical protein LRAMOSA09811 [Lichtheimia ramosa]|uniref:Uncharacterized protein n=1 Tax=Lichtheimia ramosa TaxID=688394 RepID=A0A077WMY5_9FUNG|nr:hypothetical protein LRAMOSA09811 [Lichtheimia ramosa]